MILDAFDDIASKYPHLGNHSLSGDMEENIQFLLKGQALNAPDGVDGLELGVKIAGMLLFLTVRTQYTDLGLPALNYLRSYYGHPAAPDELGDELAAYLVEYLPYLAEVMSISRGQMEELIADARVIIEGSKTQVELLSCYELLALKAMGQAEEAERRSKELRAIGWSKEATGCKSCNQTIKVNVALAYDDLEQAHQLTDQWMSKEISSCTRGPQDILGEMAWRSWQSGATDLARLYANEQEKCLLESQKMYTRKAVLPLLEYYVATENWEKADHWFNELAEGLFSTVFALQRLRFLKVSYELMDHYEAIEKTELFFPEKIAPIPLQANGLLSVSAFKEWLVQERDALAEIIDKRNNI
ncbi:hypothetical protein [Lewinella cohaerens]|uniref:hypothetical protein n=1 Tax=Lewinella cohaerens TaxID=70995 RepID=UPI00037AA168|nr:hypothetical protein [Lewinella cohaerens]